MLKFNKKFNHALIRSVINIDKENYIPFVNEKIMSDTKYLKSSSSNYVTIYPKQISEFLLNQGENFKFNPNSEVIKQIKYNINFIQIYLHHK
jgi:hypothetical protein